MKLLHVLAFLFLGSNLFASSPPDEGMWLPMLIKDYNYAEMERLGCKLTPEQIYSVNNSSLKDAIVQLGGFCTAEVISNEGLLFTNHHCAYDAIASQSTEEHNYLKTGFWAKNKGEELHIPELSVTFLIRMEDVTDRILKIKKGKDGLDDDMAIQEEITKIEAENSENDRYSVEVKEMFDGNGYYVFVYEVYNDIRLVGAPPSSIGKFGGDTDNWMWPRHTGDFSMLRIYAGKDNSPAEYSSSNVPMNPRHSLPISMKGIDEGDFTMVMGYPGSTSRYLTSYEVKNLQEKEAPALIELMGERLRIMRSVMDKSETLEIENASNYASLSNSYKYYKGQLLGLDKFKLVEQKKMYETSLTQWIKADKARSEKYSNLLSGFEAIYAADKALDKDVSIVNIAGFGPEFISLGISIFRMQRLIGSSDETALQAMKDIVADLGQEYMGSNKPAMDREIVKFALDQLKNELSADRRADFFNNKIYTKKAKGSNERFAAMIMDNSMLGNAKLLEKFLKKPTQKALDQDPGMIYINGLIDLFRSKLQAAQIERDSKLIELRELYMQAIREKESSKTFYPDANFSMRLTYGTVKSYDSWEGKRYETFTSANQILDKYKAGDSEFDVPEKLRTLISTKDFGDYARKDGTMPVCFLHNTDITGGNSGSPVINANGELIGIAFDGNWESMTSDLFWQDDYVRTISVDIRYVLFIIDKFAGASHLLDEMKLVK